MYEHEYSCIKQINTAVSQLTDIVSSHNCRFAGVIHSTSKVGRIPLCIREKGLAPRVHSLQLTPAVCISLIQNIIKHIHKCLYTKQSVERVLTCFV